MKHLKHVAIPLVLILLCGCATTGDQPNILTVEEEKKLGAELAEQVEKEEKILDDPIIQEYIDGIGERVSRQSPRQDVEYKFTVIEAPDTVNAYALPGGHMYIYTGLLHLAQNEAELASVMAHEIAHVAAEHHGEALTREYNMSILLGLIFGDTESGAAQAAQVVKSMRTLSFSRAQEKESDTLGMEMMWRSGYRPDAMVDFMARMGEGQQMPSGAAGRFLTYLSSHPPTQARVDALRAQLSRYPAEERAQSPLYTERYVNTVHKRLPKREAPAPAGE